MNSPYTAQPRRAFWKLAAEGATPADVEDLYTPRFLLDRTTKVATAGSCFAQHIGINLRRSGVNVLDFEPPPQGTNEALLKAYGFGLYSARYGNIYHVRQFFQLLQEAHGEFEPRNAIWEARGRWFDALRPSVEPDGLASQDEVRILRRSHLNAVRRIVESADVFIFTMGLTEAWMDADSDTVYPTAPGTVCGSYDPTRFRFHNFSSTELAQDLRAALTFLRRMNPAIRVILTVSPVPLTATASGRHVVVATTYSKSALRAVAGEAMDRFDFVDYFPSFELVASHWSKARLYEPNLRGVTPDGVATVMRHFLTANGLLGVDAQALPGATPAKGAHPKKYPKGKRSGPRDVCEDQLLEAFAK